VSPIHTGLTGSDHRFRHRNDLRIRPARTRRRTAPADEEMACPSCGESYLFGFECPDCGGMLVSESLIGFNPAALAWRRPSLFGRLWVRLLVRIGRRPPQHELNQLARGWRKGLLLTETFDDLLAD